MTGSYIVNVLVVEAGPFDEGEDSVLIPGDYPAFQYFDIIVAEPLEGLNNRSVDTLCAKVVGGGSVVNAMVYLRYVKYLPKFLSVIVSS